MRPKKAMEQIRTLLKAPSFTSKEARKHGVDSATLAHYVKQGELQRVGHGIYRGTNAPTSNDFRWEDLIEATQRVKGGVVCLTSALSLYGLTEEIPRQHWIAIRNDTVHRTGPATKVIRMRNLTLGKIKMNVGDISIPIFNRERTIVDAFRYLSRETSLKALRAGLKKKGAEKIDLEKIRKYAKTLRFQIEPYLLAVTV